MVLGGYWYYITDVNPEPWAIGPLGTGRKDGRIYPYVGPNQQLKTYQLAIKEEMQDRRPVMLDVPHVRLTFWFWRRIDKYTTPGAAAARKHEADATNLQKGLEDALQGILYLNDRCVADVRSVVVKQDPETRPLIIIHAIESPGADLEDIPTPIWHEIQDQPVLISSNKHLENPEDIF